MCSPYLVLIDCGNVGFISMFDAALFRGSFAAVAGRSHRDDGS